MIQTRWAVLPLALTLELACAGALATPHVPVSAPLTLSGAGPYHQLHLPLVWQAQSPSGDLSDLRVVNAAREALPHAWMPLPDPVAVPHSTVLSWFKWAGPAQGAPAVSASGVAASPVSSTWPIWILDARRVPGSLQQLVLDLRPSSHGVFSVALESSDDLQRWTPVHDSVDIASLSRDGQRLLQQSIELGGLSPAYLRLRLLPGSAEPTLSQATVVSSEAAQATPAWSWSGRIRATQCGAAHCDYVVPASVPLGRLKVHLAQANTLLILNVQGLLPTTAVSEPSPPDDSAQHGHRQGLRDRLRALRDKSRNSPADDRRPTGAQDWVEVADGQVHWIDTAGQVARSDELPLDQGRYRMLRLNVRQGDAGWTRTPPEIEVATWVRSLVFLARGAGPYRLEWTHAHDRSTEVSLAQLMPVTGPEVLRRFGRAELPERPAMPRAAPPPSADSKGVSSRPARAGTGEGRWPMAVWLWGALLLGLGLMAYMVRGVLSEPAAAGRQA